MPVVTKTGSRQGSAAGISKSRSSEVQSSGPRESEVLSDLSPHSRSAEDIMVRMAEDGQQVTISSDPDLQNDILETESALRDQGQIAIPDRAYALYYDHTVRDASLLGYDISRVGELHGVVNPDSEMVRRLGDWEDRRRTYFHDVSSRDQTFEIVSCAINGDGLESIHHISEVRGYKVIFTALDYQSRVELVIVPPERQLALGAGMESIHEFAVGLCRSGCSPIALREHVLAHCESIGLPAVAGFRSPY